MKEIQIPVEDRMRALESLELLAGCSESERAELADKAHVLSFDTDEAIVREGEPGLGFYLVLSGRADVRQGGQVINRLGQGEFFGEIALLEGVPRTADVVATEPTVCLGLVHTDFRGLLVREPRIAMEILEEEGRRLTARPLLQSPRSNDELPE